MTPNWAPGMFAKVRGQLIRLSSLHPGDQPTSPQFAIEYVSYYESGAGVTCGGHSSAFTKELRPVVDVTDIIICRAYAAMQAASEAKKEAARQTHEFEVHLKALVALKDAQRASAEMLKLTTEAKIEGEL